MRELKGEGGEGRIGGKEKERNLEEERYSGKSGREEVEYVERE
jgi:hypothetical protein